MLTRVTVSTLLFATSTIASAATSTCKVDETAPAAAIVVQIRDTAGALIPLATVDIQCGAHTHTVQTGANGEATVKLHPGSYDVTASAAGFAVSTQQALPIAASGLVVTLAAGAATDTVNVTATGNFVPYDSNAGSKTNAPLLEVPQSISIVNQQELEARQVITMNEALRYNPWRHR